MDTSGRVLVVDDEPNAVKVLSVILSKEGYDVVEALNVDGAVRALSKTDVDAVITDVKMPGKDGVQFFEYLNENHPDIPVIFLTAYGTVEAAVSAVTRGAFYYFIKPPDYQKLKEMIVRAVELRRMKRELESLKKRLSDKNGQCFVGNTPEVLRIFEAVESVKEASSSVLILGETGTGKELIARALHYNSYRKDEPFVAVNCAAIPTELMEAELFGYEKGAYTGAHAKRIGRVEEASGGTLFLDEIGELAPSLQAKLLRVLQEKEIERLGSSKKVKVDFRLVSSTNRDLRNEVQSGNFREDLFYRVNVVEIWVPPLRDRKDDIPLLASEFVSKFCAREKKLLSISDDVVRKFHEFYWPGNVRQLKNVIERAVVLAKGNTITLKDLPRELLPKKSSWESVKTLKDLQILAIRNALKEANGNKSKAARMLGISRKAFYKRLRGTNFTNRI